MDLSEILKSSPAIGAAILAVFGALYKAAKALLEFNDEYLRKRQFKRLSFLLGEVSGHDQLHMFVESAKQAEVFRAAFGKPTSPRLAKAVMALYATERFSLEELRVSSPYFSLNEEGVLDVELGKAGTFIFWTSVFFVVAMAVYTIAVVVSLLFTKTLVTSLLALSLLVGYFMFAWYFGRDAHAILLARNAARKIKRMRENELKGAG